MTNYVFLSNNHIINHQKAPHSSRPQPKSYDKLKTTKKVEINTANNIIITTECDDEKPVVQNTVNIAVPNGTMTKGPEITVPSGIGSKQQFLDRFENV